MEFLHYPPKFRNLPDDGSPVADVANHCSTWEQMREPGDLITSCHEGSHGVHADLRNERVAFDRAYRTSPRGVRMPSLPRPVRGEGVRGAEVNACYFLGDRAVKVQEPPFRKSDVIPYIPESLRGFRFPTYVSGQSAWDGQPLYLWDEWCAYVNGARQAVFGGKADGSDWVRAPLEFCAYGVAVLLKAKDAGCLTQPLKDCGRFLLVRSFNVYLEGKDLFPFDGQQALYSAWQGGDACKGHRDFCAAELGWSVPDAVVPEDGQPAPPVPWDFY